jgi:AcrR family transcriptional regulator
MIQLRNSHMTVAHPRNLKPRKTPRQARAEATVDAILEATIQVLLSEGARRLTTTRVAARAGVSVGTMYQYFPHKEALLYAVLKQHLDTIAEAVEAACARLRGQAIATIGEGLVLAYLDAKMVRVDVSRALYLVSADLDTSELMDGIAKRILDATTVLLASAADAEFDDLSVVTFTLLAAMSGAVRTVFERGAAPSMLRDLRTHLTTMCRAYLEAVANHETDASGATPQDGRDDASEVFVIVV